MWLFCIGIVVKSIWKDSQLFGCWIVPFLSTTINPFALNEGNIKTGSSKAFWLSAFSSFWTEAVTFLSRGAAVAQWIHLRLPSCHPGFESQAHHLCFNQFIFEWWHAEKTKINKKRPGLAHFLKQTFQSSVRYSISRSMNPFTARLVLQKSFVTKQSRKTILGPSYKHIFSVKLCYSHF